jgi:hypothetical protein
MEAIMAINRSESSKASGQFIEALESRTLFDLVPTAVSNIPANVVGGQHTNGAIFVDVENTGAAAIRGDYTLTLLVSPDGAIGDASAFTTRNEFLARLNPGTTRAVRVAIGNYPAVAAGNYHVLAEIGGSLAGVGDNVVASTETVNIATPFIDLTDSIRLVGPSTIDPGQRYGLVVTVTNNGNAIARGPLEFQLGTSAASDGSSTTIISTPTRPLVLPAGRSESFLFVERVAAGTAPGSFFGDVTIDPNDTFGESNTTNNFAVTSGEETVRDPYDNILGTASGSFHVILGPDRGDVGTLNLDVMTEDSTNGDLSGTATDSLGNGYTFSGTVSPFGIIRLSTDNTGNAVTGSLRGIIVAGGNFNGLFRESNGDFITFGLTLPTEA